MRIPVDKSRVITKQGLKSCGLCPEKCDSFVELTMDLRVFLKTFLSPPNPDYDLPYKICVKCYKTTCEAKTFKDRSNTAMTRLLKEGRRDLFSKDRRRPKILLDWKDKHNADKVINRMAREEKEESGDVEMQEEDIDKAKDRTVVKESTTVTERPKETRIPIPENKASNYNESSVQEVPKPVPNKEKEISEQLSDAMEIVQEATKNDVEEDLSSLVDEEEQFPESGPYQCELCNEIFETKEDFLICVKTNHAEEVDAEVIDALERDVKIRKAKRKAGKI